MIRTIILLLLCGCADNSVERGIASLIPAPTSTIRLVEDLRVGAVEVPGSIIFNRIGHISVGEDGVMYLTDWSELTVWVVSPEGTLIGQLGRRGDGPGEFRNLFGTEVVGDSVLVLEMDNIAVFDRKSLAHIRDYSMDAGAGRYVNGIELVSGADVFVNVHERAIPGRAKVSYIARTRLGGDSLDYLFAVDTLVAEPPSKPVEAGGQAITGLGFLAGAGCVHAETYFYCGHSGTPTIRMISGDGEARGHFEVAFSPLPFTTADRVHYTERFAGTVFEDVLELPEYWPLYAGFIAEADDLLWVTLRNPRDESTKTLWRLDLTHGVSQEATIDGDVTLHVASHGKLYGIRVDSTGVRSLVRYVVEE